MIIDGHYNDGVCGCCGGCCGGFGADDDDDGYDLPQSLSYVHIYG